jgi:hypothetical protein
MDPVAHRRYLDRSAEIARRYRAKKVERQKLKTAHK